MSTRKRYTKEFKLEAVRLLAQSERPAAEVSRELGVCRNQLYKWKHVLLSRGEAEVFRGPGRNAASDQRSEAAVLRRRGKGERRKRGRKRGQIYFS